MPASRLSPLSPPLRSRSRPPSRSRSPSRPKPRSNNSRPAPPRKRRSASSGSGWSSASIRVAWRPLRRWKLARAPPASSSVKPMRRFLAPCRKSRSVRWPKPNSASAMADSSGGFPRLVRPVHHVQRRPGGEFQRHVGQVAVAQQVEPQQLHAPPPRRWRRRRPARHPRPAPAARRRPAAGRARPAPGRAACGAAGRIRRAARRRAPGRPARRRRPHAAAAACRHPLPPRRGCAA